MKTRKKTSGNTYVTSNTSLSADGEVSYVSQSEFHNPYPSISSHDVAVYPGAQFLAPVVEGAPHLTATVSPIPMTPSAAGSHASALAPSSSNDVGIGDEGPVRDVEPRRDDIEVMSLHNDPLENVALISLGEANNHLSFQGSIFWVLFWWEE